MRELFSKVLSATDVTARFSVPTHSVWAFQIPQGSYEIDFLAKDMTDQQWHSFRLKTRENDHHPKPVFSAGWLAYVHAKDLQEGDRVILYLEEGEANRTARFGIRAERFGFKLLGADIWTAL